MNSRDRDPDVRDVRDVIRSGAEEHQVFRLRGRAHGHRRSRPVLLLGGPRQPDTGCRMAAGVRPEQSDPPMTPTWPPGSSVNWGPWPPTADGIAPVLL